MSLHEPVPEVDLTPEVVPILGEGNARDVLRLLSAYYRRPQFLFDYDHLLRMRDLNVPRRFRLTFLERVFGIPKTFSVLLIMLGSLMLIAAGSATITLFALAAGVNFSPALLVAAIEGAEQTIVAAFITFFVISVFLGTVISGFIAAANVALWLPLLLIIVFALGEPRTQMNLLFPFGASTLIALSVGGAVAGYLAFTRSKIQSRETLMASTLGVAFSCSFIYMLLDYAHRQDAWSFEKEGPFLAASLLGAFIGAALGVARLDDWLIGSRKPVEPATASTALAGIPFVTPLPVSWVKIRLDDWLDYNWKRGMVNVWEVWTETRQQRLLSDLLVYKLTTFPANGKLFSTIGTIADWERGCDWRLLFRHDPAHAKKYHFNPAERAEVTVPPPAKKPQDSVKQEETSPSIIRRNRGRRVRWMHALAQPVTTPLIHQVQPYEIASAGFYYLSRCYVHEAANVFPRVPGKLDGQTEMVRITESMLAIWKIEEISKVPKVKLEDKPKEAQRNNTWDTFNDINEVIQLAWLFRECKAPQSPPPAGAPISDKEWCYTMCVRKLEEILEKRLTVNTDPRPKTALPETERRFVERLVSEWTQNLTLWHDQPPDRVPIEKFRNPFHFTEPLRNPRDKYLVGRDTLIFEINRAWKRGNFQTIVITGQPFIGKTSLVLNSGKEADSRITISCFKVGHIQRYDSPVKQFLFSLCANVGIELAHEPPPAKEDDWDHDPYRTCELYLQKVCRDIVPYNLIVVIDDFDRLDELFVNTIALDRCLSFLVHLHQSIERLGFVFVTRFPEARFQSRNSNPFASTSRFIQVSYLGANESDPAKKLAPTKALLNGRLRDDGPRFRDEAIDFIYTLTHGHPYLNSLIGYMVTKRFLKRLADREDPNPLFNQDDVQVALDASEFKVYLGRYGQEVLSYLSEGIGRQFTTAIRAVLWWIAQSQQGAAETTVMTLFVPSAITSVGELHRLLMQIAAYDIIEEYTEDGISWWRIEVELFRQWLAAQPR